VAHPIIQQRIFSPSFPVELVHPVVGIDPIERKDIDGIVAPMFAQQFALIF
jgi:hypothetical protein